MSDQNEYVEMVCPPELAPKLLKGLKEAKPVMQEGRMIGEWRDRSPILSADNYTFHEMMFMDPRNAAYIIHDYAVYQPNPEDSPRVFLKITPLNRTMWNSMDMKDWVIMPRVIGNTKSNIIHFITADIMRKVEDAKMKNEAMLKDLGLTF